MILLPLFDFPFLNEYSAGGAGTANRRHSAIAPKDNSRRAETL
jgi:hypothetical protein